MSVRQMFASTPSAFLSLGNMVEWGNGGRLVIFFFPPHLGRYACTAGMLVIIQENPEGLITTACRFSHIAHTDGH